MKSPETNSRLLVCDCHEAWIYQLGQLDQPMDVIVGLKGRHTSSWDTAMRPVPQNARIIRLQEALACKDPYDCVIAHNLSDLLDLKALIAPRLFVLHGTLEGILAEQRSRTTAEELRSAVAQYVRLTGAHVVAVSALKGHSWGFESDIVPLSADPREYLEYRGDLARGLRVANHIHNKKRTLLWDFHEHAFEGIPLTIVGHNDDMPGVLPARDWRDLKHILSRHRFFVHTADPQYEDGYNMATLEAMAAGLPVLGNRHPTSPIEHGVSGFLAGDPQELKEYARRLLGDAELAARLGREARKRVADKFSPLQFKKGLLRSIDCAGKKWRERAFAGHTA
ncbi:MAG: glycosyltransferase family 4 protein [Candidatus Acidiferrales bacterium]